MRKCDRMKRKANLRVYFPDYPDGVKHNVTRQRQTIRVDATLPPEDVPDLEGMEELREVSDVD